MYKVGMLFKRKAVVSRSLVRELLRLVTRSMYSLKHLQSFHTIAGTIFVRPLLRTFPVILFNAHSGKMGASNNCRRYQ